MVSDHGLWSTSFLPTLVNICLNPHLIVVTYSKFSKACRHMLGLLLSYINGPKSRLMYLSCVGGSIEKYVMFDVKIAKCHCWKLGESDPNCSDILEKSNMMLLRLIMGTGVTQRGHTTCLMRFLAWLHVFSTS